MTTYQELLVQKYALEKQSADLERQLQEARKAERASVISQIRQLLTQNELTVDDLGGQSSGGKTRKTSTAGRAVAPKYRDPITGNTWSGRGLKPKWVEAALATGKTLDQLKI